MSFTQLFHFILLEILPHPSAPSPANVKTPPISDVRHVLKLINYWYYFTSTHVSQIRAVQKSAEIPGFATLSVVVVEHISRNTAVRNAETLKRKNKSEWNYSYKIWVVHDRGLLDTYCNVDLYHNLPDYYCCLFQEPIKTKYSLRGIWISPVLRQVEHDYPCLLED